MHHRRTFARLPRAQILLAGIFTILLAGSTMPMESWAERGVPEPADGIDTTAHEWVEATLAGMDLRQRVAQLVFPWIRGGSIPRNNAEYRRIQRWIQEDRVGGLIVSRGPVAEFAPTLNGLQARASVPLLIVSDLETGPSMRLTGGTTLPPAMAFGAANEESLAYEAGRLTGIEARAAGIHVTLGPVLDVNSNPLNPIINTRSFGENPDQVGRLASAWIAGARSGGLLTVGKHFPGHGATEVDSHIGLPTLTAGARELEELDLVPFRRAIDAGMNGVLVGHIAVPAIDGPGAPPASLSPRVVGGVLRDEFGFDGLVITDALNMGAITRNYTVAEASILALLAGADVLLQPPGEREVIGAIVRAVESGRIPAARIDESVRRVLRAKAMAGLNDPGGIVAPGGRTPSAHARVGVDVSAASVTLARDNADLVPLPLAARRILHVAYSGDGSRFSASTFNSTLQATGRTVESAMVNGSTSAATYRALRERAIRSDLILVSANLVPREYRGPLALQAGLSRFVEDLMINGVPVVAISFGSPYLLDFFPAVPAYLLGWSAGAESQRALARALTGQTPITGRLPVSLPPHHLAGDGLFRGGELAGGAERVR
jgi:beta-N-acetylhexosaminidase